MKLRYTFNGKSIYRKMYNWFVFPNRYKNGEKRKTEIPKLPN